MPIDPVQMRIAVVKKQFMEEYMSSGFSEEECVETIAKQFHVGKKIARETVHKIYHDDGGAHG